MPKASFIISRPGPCGVTAVKACSAQRFARHSHDEYGIGLVLAGAQRSWSGRGPVEAGAGDLITVNPGEVHDGRAVGETRTWAMLYLEVTKVAAIGSDAHDGRRCKQEFAHPVLRDARAARRFTAAYRAHVGGNDQARDEQLLLLLNHVLRDPTTPEARMVPPMARVQARIDDDPAGDHPLDALARLAGVGKFETLRGFARLTGLTPHAYVVQRRLELARALIRRGVRLADAGCRAGFADQSHFHRAFVRRYGMTPGTYAMAMR
jgi:AraC-like DNA-binding protein